MNTTAEHGLQRVDAYKHDQIRDVLSSAESELFEEQGPEEDGPMATGEAAGGKALFEKCPAIVPIPRS